MRATQHGRIRRAAVAVVGVWDPFLPSHASLLETLREHARSAERSATVVLLDPPPGSISGFAPQYGTHGWPVYNSVGVRIRLIRGHGVDAVLRVRFRRRDFEATAAEFLDAVRSRLELAELWLGELQLLGPGPQGARGAVAEYAERHDFRLTVLPRAPVGTYDIRNLLATGRLADAIEIVGRPPTWARPPSGVLRLAWRPGRYRAVALRSPMSTGGAAMDVILTAREDGPARLSWPDRDIAYLAFVAGPAD